MGRDWCKASLEGRGNVESAVDFCRGRAGSGASSLIHHRTPFFLEHAHTLSLSLFLLSVLC